MQQNLIVEFIEKLSEGFETSIGENGAKVSAVKLKE